MEADSMACKCGGVYGEIKGRLACVKCGLLAPYQPVTIEKLLAENTELKAYIVTLEDILDDLGYQGSHRKPRQNAPD